VVKPAGIRNGAMAFVVSYQGRRIKVRLSEELLEDLATKYGLSAPNTDKEALAVFQAERHGKRQQDTTGWHADHQELPLQRLASPK
jgi:hypothetical protein